jgi:aryl-alcohol dehydrogenase-like predicted oxidoreductase/predicted kinase
MIELGARVGLGAMRLSTEPDRDEARAAAVLDAAIAAGVELIDTADAYAHDDRDVGHNERLVAAAIARAARPVLIATKGGLTRPGGAWVPDGRARSLAAAAAASRARLGIDRIELYLLHAVDPRVPLATSVRALARLRDDGVVRAIGLSNVGLAQLEHALAIAPIDAVEVELGPWNVDAIRGGLVAACARRGITLLAHRPLGGPAGVKRLAREPLVVELAARLGATAAELALAWVRAQADVIVPLPGATQLASARSAARLVELDAEARAALDARFLAVGSARVSSAPSPAEVVLIAGMPAAGKSTLAAEYVARGYLRLNRDERGGTLLGLARELDRALAGGAAKVVLDNTYVDRAARAPVVEVARRHGARVRCVLVATAIEDAQVHAVSRMLAHAGRLLEPDELARAARRDPGMIGPGAQFRWRREHEPPAIDEGFDAIDEVRPPRGIVAGARAAVIVTLDELIWHGRPARPEEVRLVDGAAARVAAWRESGLVVAGTTWLPGVSDGAFAGIAARLRDALGAPIELARCAHAAGPPVCWCRKPLPGLGLALARAHDLDLARSIVVGRGAADRGFAARLGARFDEDEGQGDGGGDGDGDGGGGGSTDV